MTHRVVFSRKANAQLTALLRYIAREASLGVARTYVDAIVEHCHRLRDFPMRGTPRDDLRPGVRTIAFRRRVVIAYAVHAAKVEILGVFYGGQDMKSLFRDG